MTTALQPTAAATSIDLATPNGKKLPMASFVEQYVRGELQVSGDLQTFFRRKEGYDGLALDSWLRGQFYKTYNKGRVCKDKKIERHYARFGEWKGLAIWCDMTEKWFE